MPFTLQGSIGELQSHYISTVYVLLRSRLGRNLCKKKNGLLTFSIGNLCEYKCFWFSNLLEDKQMKPGVTDSSSSIMCLGNTMFQEHYEIIIAPIKNCNAILPLTTSHHATKGNLSPFPPHRI